MPPLPEGRRMTDAEKDIWQPRLKGLLVEEARSLVEHGIPAQPRAPLHHTDGTPVSDADLRVIFAERIRYSEHLLGQTEGSLPPDVVRDIIDAHFTADSTPAGLREKVARLRQNPFFKDKGGTGRINRLMDGAVCSAELTPEEMEALHREIDRVGETIR